MKRRNFIRNTAAAGATAFAYPAVAGEVFQPGVEKAFYELIVYHISRGGNNKGLLLDYYNDALIPFLRKSNAKVLLFDEYSQEEPVTVYALVSYPSSSVYLSTKQLVWSDSEFIAASKSFFEVPLSTPVFSRFETYLLESFDRFPALVEPAEGKNLFELRIYESPTEEAGLRKVKMFNLEEIDIFEKYGLEPVFFGRVMAGDYMPALIYMVALPDIEVRDAEWARFNNSPEWALLRVKPEYANIVSNIRRKFLVPAKTN